MSLVCSQGLGVRGRKVREDLSSPTASQACSIPHPCSDGAPSRDGALCFVVMRRPGGLLAVPPGTIPQEEIHGAEPAEPSPDVGPSSFVCSCCEPCGGTDVDVVVVDVAEALVNALTQYQSSQVEEAYIMGYEDLSIMPGPVTLLRFASEWISLTSSEQLTFYSAEKAGEETGGPKAKAAKAKSAEKAKIIPQDAGIVLLLSWGRFRRSRGISRAWWSTRE